MASCDRGWILGEDGGWLNEAGLRKDEDEDGGGWCVVGSSVSRLASFPASRDRPSEKGGGEAGGWREIGSISDSPNIYLTHF